MKTTNKNKAVKFIKENLMHAVSADHRIKVDGMIVRRKPVSMDFTLKLIESDGFHSFASIGHGDGQCNTVMLKRESNRNMEFVEIFLK